MKTNNEEKKVASVRGLTFSRAFFGPFFRGETA